MQQGESRISRRSVLLGTGALLVFGHTGGHARTIKAVLPWQPYSGTPPKLVKPGNWTFFTPDEGRMVKAMVNRLIPADENSPSGTDCGCVTFIDNQLSGTYGRAEGLYMKGPFLKGTVRQGSQNPDSPAVHYRKALKAIDAYVRNSRSGKAIHELQPTDIDAVLTELESGKAKLEGADASLFFSQLMKDTKEGFFSDPVYGGNRDMAAWKMIGFPGARYDLRDWVGRHNERYPYPPISIAGR